jgi:hypothetical protein
MRTLILTFPKADLRALLDDKQRQLTFTENSSGEPIHVIFQVAEHLPLGQKPKRFGGML